MGCTETACETTCETACHGLRPLDALDPDEQARLIAYLAQQARVIRLALDDARDGTRALAQGVERALGHAMDAEADAETEAALRYLSAALRDARHAGLRLSAQVDEVQLDGVLGTQRLPVLTAVLSSA
jgi:hypothetical protein